MSKLWIAGVVLGLVVANTAQGADHKRTSTITSLEPKLCKVIKRHPDGNTLECPGISGYPVYFAEGDLRAFLSFGSKPETRRAAQQTPGPFNTPFEKGHRRATIEWRIVKRFGRELPHATIVRYFISRDGQKSQALVVTRVTDKEACHVAYIDATANADAIMLARRIADEVAPKFDCKNEPSIEGKAGLLGG